jgi:hypothetical protein
LSASQRKPEGRSHRPGAGGAILEESGNPEHGTHGRRVDAARTSGRLRVVHDHDAAGTGTAPEPGRVYGQSVLVRPPDALVQLAAVACGPVEPVVDALGHVEETRGCRR